MAEHLSWINYYALLFGSVYFVLDFPFDVFFVKKISQKNWATACILSLVCHSIATFTAFYAIPVATYAITNSDQAWFRVGLFGAGTGILTTFPEYLCLRLILKKPISKRNFTFLFWNKLSVFWLSVALIVMTGLHHNHQ